MEINRRGFIGSVIGLVATSHPFLALLPQSKMQRVKLPYRMFFKDDINGYLLQAPAVEQIVKIQNGYVFQAEKLTTVVPIRVSGGVLTDEHLRVIKKFKFSNFATLERGESMIVNYEVNADMPGLSLDFILDGLKKQDQDGGKLITDL